MRKPRLLMLRGLPASGKTTYAKELEATGKWFRANKDDIRKSYFPDWTFKDEAEVMAMEDADIIAELRDGNNVVVDDANLHPKHVIRLMEIAKNEKAKFQIKDFDTHVEECIKRNERRAEKIPKEAILEMHNKYLNNDKKVEYNDKLEECIIVDVDGTLAHIDPNSPRNPYDASRAMEDVLDDAVANVVAMAYGHGYKVVVLTGRHTGHLGVTKDWLAANGVSYDEIYCRKKNDKRADYIVKRELFDKRIRGRYNVKYVIDDRPSIVRMWQSLGLTTFAVGNQWKEF